jgi:putative transposase
MQYLNRFYPIRLRAATRQLEQALSNNNEVALKRKEVLGLWDKHGFQVGKDISKVSRSTLYAWKRLYKAGGTKELTPLSRTPIRKRRSKIHPLVKEFIKDYRNEHPRIGQDKIKPLLDIYCKEKQINTISPGSIALIIKQLKANNELKEYTKVRYNGKTGRIHAVKLKKKRKKQRRKGYKPKQPGDLIQLDTVTKFIDGLKYYIITAIDLHSKFAFALPYKTLNSINATDFMEKFKRVSPFEIKRIQTDNGLEFEKHFRHYVKNEQITHFHNYPKRPQSNGCIERFNRTIQENFINWNLHMLNNPQEFANAMIDWLLWYNTERVHHSLGLKTPMNAILEQKFGSNYKYLKKSSMLLDYTNA